MSFNVPADAYARFMGQYSEPLAGQFVDWPTCSRANELSTSVADPAH